MIRINTVYPCTTCGEEIPPTVKFCPSCGAQQPPLGGREHFNLFSQRQRDTAFAIKFGGDPILSLEDATELCADEGMSEAYPTFMGAYIPDDQKPGATVTLTRWVPVVNGQLGEDLGPRTIEITCLE